MKFQFNIKYFIISVLLFSIEVAIAIFLKEGFIRYSVGDFLVVILMYFFIRSFIKAKPLHIAIATLLIAYAVEFLQMANLLDYLDLRNNKWAAIIMGTHFSIEDLIAYTLGVVLVFYLDKGIFRRLN
ncbi:MAG: DUF2809 domain-containing protein [Flavobacteriaceae bacterium]